MTDLSKFLSMPSNQPFIAALLIADLILRGIALYKTARKDQKVWFVALLIINSLGILPLVYLFLHRGVKTIVVASPPKKTKKKARK